MKLDTLVGLFAVAVAAALIAPIPAAKARPLPPTSTTCWIDEVILPPDSRHAVVRGGWSNRAIPVGAILTFSSGVLVHDTGRASHGSSASFIVPVRVDRSAGVPLEVVLAVEKCQAVWAEEQEP